MTESTIPNRRPSAPLDVLLVEDNLALAEMYATGLGVRGISVTLAHDVDSAWASITTHMPMVVLLDIDLGSGNGFDLLDRIVAQRGDQHLPRVIMFTNFESRTLQDRARAVGADGYLLKSNVRFAQLVTLMTSVVEGDASGGDAAAAAAIWALPW